MSETSMAEQEVANAATVRRYYADVWNRGDLSALPEVVGEDLVGHDPIAGDYGYQRLQEMVRLFRGAFPDFETRGMHTIAHADVVALIFHSTGTFAGEFMGRASSGRRLAWSGLVLYRFQNGRIVEIWTAWDHQQMLRDLSAPAAPESA